MARMITTVIIVLIGISGFWVPMAPRILNEVDASRLRAFIDSEQKQEYYYTQNYSADYYTERLDILRASRANIVKQKAILREMSKSFGVRYALMDYQTTTEYFFPYYHYLILDSRYKDLKSSFDLAAEEVGELQKEFKKLNPLSS